MKDNLPFDIVKTIPRSIRKRWREQAEKDFWMPVPVEDNISDELTIRRLQTENKILKTKVRALFILLFFTGSFLNLWR